jgi:hypothetical protein
MDRIERRKKMKKYAATAAIAFVLILTAGCTSPPAPVPTPQPSVSQDAVSSASIVDSIAALQKAIGKTGTWIIAITKDLSADQALVLDGSFVNGKKDADGKDIVQRKIALYAQDANRNITARYTLATPKLTINSPQASLQHGTFKGEIYVTTNDFQLVDMKVLGNIYFLSDAAKAGFKMDGTSTVSGKQEVKK